MLALTLITAAILIGYLFVKSVLDHKASVHEEEHRAFEAFGDVVAVPQELRPARKMAEGGKSEQRGRAVTGGDWHYHRGASL